MSEIDRIAKLRRAELEAQLRLEPERLQVASTRAMEQQLMQFPEATIGPAKSKLVVDDTAGYDTRSVDDALVEGAKLFREIMGPTEAIQFANDLKKEGDDDVAGTKDPSMLFLAIDNWDNLKESILKRFKTKTTIVALYAFVVNQIQKSYSNGGYSYTPDLTTKQSFKDTKQQAQDADIQRRADQLAQDQAKKTADLDTIYQGQANVGGQAVAEPLIGIAYPVVEALTQYFRLIGADAGATQLEQQQKPMASVYKDALIEVDNSWDPERANVNVLRMMI